jgi:hypothetical protein
MHFFLISRMAGNRAAPILNFHYRHHFAFKWWMKILSALTVASLGGFGGPRTWKETTVDL